MGWFSPIKGSYPSLGQIDKTLPVATGNSLIERGTVIEMASDTVNADGAFKIAADASHASLLYIALQDYDDAQAGMAGTNGFDATVGSSIDVPESMRATAGVPTITGLALAMEGEYETSMFDPTSLASAPIGAGLSVRNGKFIWPDDSASSNDDYEIVAYLTGKPTNRWVNNAVVKANGTDQKHTAVRQGKNVSVIRFRTK